MNASPKQPQRKAQGSKPIRAVRNELLGVAQGKETDSASILVRVTSFRKRLIDPDNLTPKWFIDCCRYCGWIEDDTAKDVSVETRQEKVLAKEDETTLIEIIEL